MISVEQCRRYINEVDLPDNKIEEIRDIIYALTESVFDGLVERSVVTNIDSTNIASDNISISK